MALRNAIQKGLVDMEKNVSDISELAEMRKNDSKKVGHILVSL